MAALRCNVASTVSAAGAARAAPGAERAAAVGVAAPGAALGKFLGLKRVSNGRSSAVARVQPQQQQKKAGSVVAPKAVAVETLEKTDAALVEKSVNTIRFLAIDAVEKANSGHPGLPMGCAPMGHILYDEVMKYNPKNPSWFNRDRFVLSAGHGCMLQYALLFLAGYDSVNVITPPHPTRSPFVTIACRCLEKDLRVLFSTSCEKN